MNLLFHSIILISLLGGCKVGTDYSANIPQKDKTIVKDAQQWNNILEGIVLESSKSSNLKVSKMVINEGDYPKGALEVAVLFGDDNKNFYSKLVSKGSFDSNISTKVAFYDLNLSERVVVLGADIENKRVEIWLDRNLVSPSGEYLEDITLDNQLFSLYKIDNLIILNREKSTKNFEISWKDVIDTLVQYELLDKPTLLKDIYLGLKIVRGRELFVINEFNISK